ncbi:hypothetical protein CISIN_1g0401431mg, partial [Citrus sinensis]
MDMERSPLTRQ